MPMHEQILRKEQDPFHKPEDQKQTEAERAAAAEHQRFEEEQRRLAATQVTATEPIAPTLLAHLPGQTGVSEEAMKHLFTHFTEREQKEHISRQEQQRTTATQTDPRTTARARDPRGRQQKELGDEFKEGFAADFLPDSEISAAALDDGPHQVADLGADAWEGASSGRKRRRGGAARGSTKKSKKGQGKP